MEIFKENNKVESKGILFKDFVRQHLKKENELENEIKQLKERIKSTSTPMYNRLYELFVKMRNYIHLSVDADGYKFSIDDFPLSSDDADFIERQIQNADILEYNKKELPDFKDISINTGKLYTSKSNYGYFTVNDEERILDIF